MSSPRKWLARALASAEWRLWAAAGLLVVTGYVALLLPMLEDFSTYGFHDWDAHSAYRYITTLSIRDYAEGPWWHPFLCGGVPAWGYVEGATNLVSPYLPFYLFADMRTAIRVEVLGNGLLGIAGAFALARRFTSSGALAGFFAALYVLNGRFALQAAVGHTWHLQYAFLPWLLWCFERAREAALCGSPSLLRPSRFAVVAGALFAYLCYAGAIYPLPHAVLFVGLYVLIQAVQLRSLALVRDFALAGVIAVGLAAPKLFALADYMRGAPRLIASNERIGLAELLVMLGDSSQRYGSFPVRVPAYNWHEWGIYVGAFGIAALVVAVVFARGPRGQVLKVLGLLCLLLGFGSFHEYAPWTLLHQVPPFSSQHVPSRFHYLMLFFLGLAFVDTAQGWLAPRLGKHVRVQVLLLLPLAVFVIDLVRVNQRPFEQAFWMRAPQIEPAERFRHLTDAAVSYEQPDWAAPMLLSMFANTGVIRCYGADPTLKIGAIAADAAGYRGQTFVAEGEGVAEVVRWTPNSAEIRVASASPGALIAYNMNYDPSWSANGEPALNHRGMVAARLREGTSGLTFRYFPRTLRYSLPLLLLTLLSLLLACSGRARALLSRWRRP